MHTSLTLVDLIIEWAKPFNYVVDVSTPRTSGACILVPCGYWMLPLAFINENGVQVLINGVWESIHITDPEFFEKLDSSLRSSSSAPPKVNYES